MNQNNNYLFFNLIKNSGTDFKAAEELLNLHKKSSQLELNLKLIKNIEYEYNKLKIKDLNERIEEIKFQKKYINKRNADILKEMESNDFNSMKFSSNSYMNLSNIKSKKKQYQNYLDVNKSKIKTEFNINIFQNNNIFNEERKNELDKCEKNFNKNNFYEELLKINEKMTKEIIHLKNKNNILIKEIQKKEKK